MMKYAVLLLMLMGSFAHAQEQLSCDELGGVADGLDQIAVALQQTDTITEGDEVDTALGEIIDALHLVAKSEQEDDLNHHVSELDQAWEDMNFNNFTHALDNVIASLDRLYKRDCEG